MKNIDDGLRGLDEVPVPDVWTTARDRGPQPPYEPEPHLGRRLGTIALALAVVVAAFAFAFSRLSEDPQTTVGGTSKITRYRFDGPPEPIAVGEGAAWAHVGSAGEAGSPGFWRIDAVTGEQRLIDVPDGEWPAVGGGSAWLLCDAAECGGHAVLQLDPFSGSVVRSIDLPGSGGQIAGVQEGVWITTDSGLSFVGKDGRVERSFPGQNYDLVGSDGASVWVSRDGGLSKIDPETGEQLAEISAFPDVCTMEVAEGTVWVASCDGGMHAGGNRDELMGIDAASGEVLFREPIPDNGQMRFLDGVLWLAERSVDGPIQIVGLDPRTGALTGSSVTVVRNPGRFTTRGLFGPHVFFAVGEGALWVTDFGAGEVIRVVPTTETSTRMPTSTPTTREAVQPSDAGGAVMTPPSLSTGQGWQTVSTGDQLNNGSYPLTWATNGTVDGRDLESMVDGALTISATPYYSLPINSGEIVIVAGLINPGDSPAPDSPTFPPRDLPLDLHDAEMQDEWEGQPSASMCRYRLWSAVNERYLELIVYFGGGCPNEDIVATAQAEVATLIVPTLDPTGDSGLGVDAPPAAKIPVIRERVGAIESELARLDDSTAEGAARQADLENQLAALRQRLDDLCAEAGQPQGC